MIGMKNAIAFLMAVGVASLQAASIKGTVVFEGSPPQLKEIKMDADPICKSKHSTAAKSEVLVLGDGQTMANVFVKVTSGLSKKEYPTPKDPAVLDQRGCVYNPHVMGVMANQTIKLLNPDGTLHNVHAMPKINKEFNMAMPTFRKEATQKFTKVEEDMFQIKCDVHPWMGGWIAVMSHPYFAVTGIDGKFSLDDLPAGTYEIEAWHEKLGTQTAKVTVAAGDSKSADFSFKKP